MFQQVGGYHCPFPLLSTLRATALGARPTWRWPLLCHGNLQVRPSSFTELARVLWNSRFSGQSLLWPTLVHSPPRCCCLSDNLQRATGQCLRDIWPQQQRRQRTGRLFSRSVTTERRFNFEARRVLALTVRSRHHLSQVAAGQASTIPVL